MDALVYEESPLADIIEGDSIPFEPNNTTPLKHEQYAPRGFPRLRNQLRSIRQKTRLVTNASKEQFLERFRYTIIASQLLAEESEPRKRDLEQPSESTQISFSLRGAYLTAVFSFSLAWILSWLRRRWHFSSTTTWSEIGLFVAVAAMLVVSVTVTARRQYLKFIQQSAISTASRLVREAQDFDTAASTALRYVQEIEVVARGYELSHPLPPVTRLDDRFIHRHCTDLRSTISRLLVTGIGQFHHFHNQLQNLIDARELETYQHIHELSPEQLTQAITYTNDLNAESQESLRQLRILYELHNIARRFLLVDLLAVRNTTSWEDIARWRQVIGTIQTVVHETSQSTMALQCSLQREEEFSPNDLDVMEQSGEMVASPTNADAPVSTKPHFRGQMRLFDSLVQGVRSLNARAKIARDEMASLIATDAEDVDMVTSLTRHYDMMGSELRSLLVEWERGRNTVLLAVNPDLRSRPSSGPRSPISPSPSLGGLTMVDGGPAEALRLLNGDEDSSSSGLVLPDEEIFEAVAKPRKRMSLALSREEKMVKLQEDRRKRATLQEQADTTTNMLRELQMVIKHRPTASRPSNKVTPA